MSSDDEPKSYFKKLSQTFSNGYRDEVTGQIRARNGSDSDVKQWRAAEYGVGTLMATDIFTKGISSGILALFNGTQKGKLPSDPRPRMNLDMLVDLEESIERPLTYIRKSAYFETWVVKHLFPTVLHKGSTIANEFETLMERFDRQKVEPSIAMTIMFLQIRTQSGVIQKGVHDRVELISSMLDNIVKKEKVREMLDIAERLLSRVRTNYDSNLIPDNVVMAALLKLFRRHANRAQATQKLVELSVQFLNNNPQHLESIEDNMDMCINAQAIVGGNIMLCDKYFKPGNEKDMIVGDKPGWSSIFQSPTKKSMNVTAQVTNNSSPRPSVRVCPHDNDVDVHGDPLPASVGWCGRCVYRSQLQCFTHDDRTNQQIEAIEDEEARYASSNDSKAIRCLDLRRQNDAIIKSWSETAQGDVEARDAEMRGADEECAMYQLEKRKALAYVKHIVIKSDRWGNDEYIGKLNWELMIEKLKEAQRRKQGTSGNFAINTTAVAVDENDGFECELNMTNESEATKASLKDFKTKLAEQAKRNAGGSSNGGGKNRASNAMMEGCNICLEPDHKQSECPHSKTKLKGNLDDSKFRNKKFNTVSSACRFCQHCGIQNEDGSPAHHLPLSSFCPIAKKKQLASKCIEAAPTTKFFRIIASNYQKDSGNGAAVNATAVDDSDDEPKQSKSSKKKNKKRKTAKFDSDEFKKKHKTLIKKAKASVKAKLDKRKKAAKVENASGSETEEELSNDDETEESIVNKLITGTEKKSSRKSTIKQVAEASTVQLRKLQKALLATCNDDALDEMSREYGLGFNTAGLKESNGDKIFLP